MTVVTINQDREQQAAGSLSVSGGQRNWSEDQRAALAALNLQDAPESELRVFLQVCQRTGLDPFSRQIYMIKRKQWNPEAQRKEDRWTIQTAIDGFRIIAERSGRYAGQTSPEWCGKDGVWRDVWPFEAAPVAARVGIYKHGFEQPLYAVAHFREYTAGNKMWETKGAVMIAKCAEALGLRKAFPNDLSGLYTSDEMAQRDAEPGQDAPAGRATQSRGDHTPKAIPARQQRAQPPAREGQKREPQQAEPTPEQAEQQERSRQALADFDWDQAILDAAAHDDPDTALDELRGLWSSAGQVFPGNSNPELVAKLRGAMEIASERKTERDQGAAVEQAREADERAAG